MKKKIQNEIKRKNDLQSMKNTQKFRVKKSLLIKKHVEFIQKMQLKSGKNEKNKN